MNSKYVLVATSGTEVSIDHSICNTLQEAQEMMRKAFEYYDGDESEDRFDDMGACILRDNDTYLWEIIEVPF